MSFIGSWCAQDMRWPSFSFYLTEDGSYSASIQQEKHKTELMHSSGGAFCETLYLYEPVFAYAHKKQLPLNFLSIGLGLGYVEILGAAYFLKFCPEEPFFIQSFEALTDLRQFFQTYFLDEKKFLPILFHQSYSSIVDLCAKHYHLDAKILEAYIRTHLQTGQIFLQSHYSEQVLLSQRFSGVFFDAFSAGTSPELWTSDLLHFTLDQLEEKSCFATYASRTLLRKILGDYRFVLEIKKGFGGKKESTFAFRD